MGRQETRFMQSEGDAWHLRNRMKNRPDLPVVTAIICNDIRPSSVLEIGCGYGANLAAIKKERICSADGIEPSAAARLEGAANYPDIRFFPGGASEVNSKNKYDLVIYGFCLYVCDRQDLFKIVAGGDRALMNKGHLIIHDFDPDYPHRVPYHHFPGMFSFKMDYSKLWLANPAYSLVNKTSIPDGTAVWILKKDMASGWPLADNSHRGQENHGKT